MADWQDEDNPEEDLELTLSVFFSVADSVGKPCELSLAGRGDVRRSLDMLVNLLKTRDQISRLDLSRCQLDVRILEALVKTRNLRTVNLSDNQIAELQPLLPMLQENAVHFVNLSGNGCARNAEDMAQLDALLEPKRYIEPLALRCLRVCILTPRVEFPSWLFRWLYTDKKEWWHRLLFHRDAVTRQGAAAFILHFLRHFALLEREQYLYPIEQTTSAKLQKIGSPHAPPPSEQTAHCLQYIDFHLSMLEVTRNYWKYFREYFTLVADFCLIGPPERLYLIKRGTIFWLLDWYMGNYSPYRHTHNRARVGSSEEPANLVPFFAALAALVRSVRSDGMAERKAPTCFDDDVLASMPRVADASLDLLWIDEVLYSMLRQGYSNEAVCTMIEHLCWSDVARTTWIGTSVYQRFIARTSVQEHMVNARMGLCRFLQINDGFQERRANMLLLVDSSSDDNRHPFFYVSPVVNRRAMDQLTSRLVLLLDLLTEDLSHFTQTAKEYAPNFIMDIKQRVLPVVSDADLESGLLPQLEALEMMVGFDAASLQHAPETAPSTSAASTPVIPAGTDALVAAVAAALAPGPRPAAALPVTVVPDSPNVILTPPAALDVATTKNPPLPHP